MRPINAKNMDGMEQVMEYTDHDHEGFWSATLAWETTSKEDHKSHLWVTGLYRYMEAQSHETHR
jgi:hypothetical protein